MTNKYLKQIEHDLNQYVDLSHGDLYKLLINQKLTRTIENYNEEIEDSSDYLLTRSSFKVIKAITKLQKKADMEALMVASESEELSDE